jgi:hypothetical protein
MVSPTLLLQQKTRSTYYQVLSQRIKSLQEKGAYPLTTGMQLRLTFMPNFYELIQGQLKKIVL